MKKRRVLALLLAFSMVLGTNGMSVLAMENAAGEMIEVTDETAQDSVGNDADTEAANEETDKSDSDDTLKDEAEKESDDSIENKSETSDTTEQTEDESKGKKDTDQAGAADAEDEQSDVTEQAPEGTTEVYLDNGIKLFTDETGIQVPIEVNAAASYKYTIEEGVLTAITDENDKPLSGVVEIAANKGIKAIGSTVFAGNVNITYVKLPSGVAELKTNAFKGCSALTGAYLPNGLVTIGDGAFESCVSLTHIAIPKSTATIGARAFYQNTKLFMVYTKDADYSSLTSIGDYAFYECQALGNFCSDTTFLLPGNLQNIGAYAFYKCSSIESINMHESVTTIGEGVFKDCNGLKEVTFSSKLNRIADKAFSGCNKLTTVVFKSGMKEIGKYAFEGCIGLGGMEIIFTIGVIDDYAFKDCTRLVAVTIPNGNVTIGEMAFPNMDTLSLIGIKDSNVELYTKDKKIKFINLADNDKSFYKYTVLATGKGVGKIIIKDKQGKDPNTLNENKGVEVGEVLQVICEVSGNNRVVTGSIKCNGTPVNYDSKNNIYNFKMPKGGALITAEFMTTGAANKAVGLADDISTELSNGNELKVGQYTRLFLLDAKDDNKAVDVSKITFASDNKEVADIDSATGMIHALKEGTAKISAVVIGGDDKTITKEVVISVRMTDVNSLKLKASQYNVKIVQITENESGIQTATLDKFDISKNTATITLKATAYDADDDNMAVDLKWSSSDPKVAAVDKPETTADNPEMKVKIPQGASGEATITITATKNDPQAKPKTVTQKFLIKVLDFTPRLAANALTVNPMKENGAILEIVSAYGRAVDPATVRLMYANKTTTETSDFTCTYLATESDGNVTKYALNPAYAGLQEKVYPLVVNINEGAYEIPLTVTVKKSSPNPKVSFDQKNKLNLFYANQGKEIVPIISGLGKDTVIRYRLEAKSNGEEDMKFLENFMIDEQTGVIMQKSESILYNSKTKKPVTAGFLILSFDGYKDGDSADATYLNADRKYAINIPTETKAPGFIIDKTADTFNKSCNEQKVLLTVKDKKTKEPVDLSGDEYVVQVLPDGAADSVEEIAVVEDGKIELTLAKNPGAGKVKIKLTNTTWAPDKQFIFNYNIKTVAANAKASLVKANITVNANYLDQDFNFELKSNQKDTVFTDEQNFVGQSNVRNAAEYEKLSVEYTGGVGTIRILDPTIKKGTYTFVCNPVMAYDINGNEMGLNKVALKVVINQVLPNVTLKGNANFNLMATGTESAFADSPELTFTVKNVPEDYVLDEAATISSIVCKTKNCEGYEGYFDWQFEDNKLQIQMSESIPYQAKVYNFAVKPVVSNGATSVTAKELKFNVKVYKGDVKVTLNAKGKVNLLGRVFSEYTVNNSVIYTPAIKNLKSVVTEAKIYDANAANPKYDDEESELFNIEVLDGKLYVTPKEGVLFENNKAYNVKIWMKLDRYSSESESKGNGVWASNNVIKIKTAQVLPKLTTDKSLVKLYMSNKNYEADFCIKKANEKGIGTIEKVYFGERDSYAPESFDLSYFTDETDGSAHVSLKLKDTLAYGTNSTNKVTVYVKFAGQGTNTEGVPVTVNVNICK